MTTLKNIVITALVALVVSSAVGFYFIGKVQTDQSNLLGGLSERDIKAVSLAVGSPTTKFNVNSSGTVLGLGTTTPNTNGDLVIDGTATSTLMISSSSSTKGGCINIENSAGTMTKAYVNGTTWVLAAGTCK